MKSLGIVRKIDSLGRVVIPREIRKANGWEEGQPLEILADDNGGVYLKAFGDDPEKQEVIGALTDLLSHTDNKQVSYICGKAIEFIKERR